MSRKRNESQRYTDIFHVSAFMTKQKKSRIDAKKRKEDVNFLAPVTTHRQAAQRMKFAMVNTFISRIKDAINIGFKSRFESAINRAVSANFQKGVKGIYPDFQISYPSIMISRGCVGGIYFPKIIIDVIGSAELSWEIEGLNGYRYEDKIYLLVFNVTRDEVAFSDYSGKRSDLSTNFNLPLFDRDDQLHYWIFLHSEDDRQISNSVYVYDVEIID